MRDATVLKITGWKKASRSTFFIMTKLQFCLRSTSGCLEDVWRLAALHQGEQSLANLILTSALANQMLALIHSASKILAVPPTLLTETCIPCQNLLSESELILTTIPFLEFGNFTANKLWSQESTWGFNRKGLLCSTTFILVVTANEMPLMRQNWKWALKDPGTAVRNTLKDSAWKSARVILIQSGYETSRTDHYTWLGAFRYN